MNRRPSRGDFSQNLEIVRQQYDDVRRLNNIQFDPTKFHVIQDSTGLYISLQPTFDIPVTKEEFVEKQISGTDVTIYGGKIVIGKTPYTCGETTVSLNTDSYVGWEFDWAAKTLSIVNFGSTMVYDDAFLRKELYYYTYTPASGSIAAYVTRERKCNVEYFPGNFGEVL
jgi:hypothetical protein